MVGQLKQNSFGARYRYIEDREIQLISERQHRVLIIKLKYYNTVLHTYTRNRCTCD